MNTWNVGRNLQVVRFRNLVRVYATGIAAGLLGAISVSAADMYRPVPTPGGIDSHPVITSTTVKGSNVLLGFKGLEGPYDVEAAPIGTTNWMIGASTTLKYPNYAGAVTVSNVPWPGTQFRMNMRGQTYVGSGLCYGCHTEIMYQWNATAHATALDALKDPSGNISSFFMSNCVVCHSTGYGQPGGFVDLATTPHLANVGCETCHGPAGSHIYLSSRQYHPVATVASETCGGCHTDPHHPTYNEWTNSPHAAVTGDLAAEFASTNLNAGQARQVNCGPCHSGATRLAMLAELSDRSNGYTNQLILPSTNDAAHFAITCVVCHDPHSTNIGPHQLRHPIFTTNFYTFFNGSDTRTNYGTNVFGQVTTNFYYMNTVFATQYVATVQVCAQCHNSRGAVWTGTSRPPHHSPQYNLLVGTFQPGFLNGTNNYIGPHGLNTNGCTACHMAPTAVGQPTELNPNYTGHEFRVALNGCTVTDCHDYGSTNVIAGLMTGVQGETEARIQSLVGLLNSWATNRAPAITNAFAAYGQYAWEFTNPGQLSNPTNNPAVVGPPSSLQSRIPDSIKKARFTVYLIEHDASKGVHNIDYTRFLLKDAKTNVQNALQ